jgi:uncharacterized membrane protein HdeD (DUF308 family)
MAQELGRHWWVLALRGVFAVLFGVLTILLPGLALSSLVLLFGAYAIVDGIGAVITGFRTRNVNDQWWLTLLEGVAGVAIGVLTFLWPGITAISLLFIIAFWAIATGVFEIATAIRLRREIENELWLSMTGLLSIIFGIVILLFPGAGALALVAIIGAYAIGFGILMLMLAFRLKGYHDHGTASAPAEAPTVA